MSTPPNILVIVSDEHAPQAMGCDGQHPVQTPALDALAAEGLAFENACCNSPICTPSRNSFFTGRYCHEIGAWDLECPLPQDAKTWGHHLGRAGYETVVCGRTHWHGPDRLHGFDRQLLDDLPKWRRDTYRPPSRSLNWRRGSRSHVTECGPGSDPWHHYDRLAASLAERFIRHKGQGGGKRPWLLYTGFVLPHFPLIAPPDLLDLYDPADVRLPATLNEPLEQQHPAIQQLRRAWCNDQPLPEATQRLATACYHALVTQVDRLVGAMVDALRDTGQLEDTIVIYASDHGEMGGHHGIWQKQCFYERSIRVPLIVRVPGEAPKRVADNVSLVDLLPTLLDVAGQAPVDSLPGRSLLEVAEHDPGAPTRTVFAEYHHTGMPRAGFMLKRGPYKLCHYVGHDTPLLFRPDQDPDEVHDLAADPAHAEARDACTAALHAMIDPEAVDRQAHEHQQQPLGGTPS